MLRASAMVVLVTVALAATAGGGQSVAQALPNRIAAPASELSTLLGFADSRLVRVDPKTLQPMPGRSIAVGSGGCAPSGGGTACYGTPAWTVSPEGRRLAVARNDVLSLRLVDVGRMRVGVTIKLGFGGGSIGALAWLVPRRIVAVQESFAGNERAVAFDVTTRRMVARRPLGGSVLQLGRTARELVLLVAPAETIGRPRIAVVDARGGVRFAALERIVAGSELQGTGSDHRVDIRSPALAVDPHGRRAFVVAQSLVAELDLRTLGVEYHSLEPPRSFLSRLWSWLEPAAAAKQVSGYHRHAQWLGGNLVAVSGSDTDGGRFRPAGLEVVEVRGWRARTIDPDAAGFEAVAELLIATGWSWDATAERAVGIGLAAYALDGDRRFLLFPGEHAWLAQVHRGQAYVGLPDAVDLLRVVDLSEGEVVATRNAPLPTLLLGPGGGWWD